MRSRFYGFNCNFDEMLKLLKFYIQDEEEISDSEDELEDRNRVVASPLSPLTPLETPTNPPAQLESGDHWQQKGK